MYSGIRKVMVVEDDPSIRNGIIDFLTLEGYEVSENENGLQALTSLKSFKPDIVISDVMMPVMDGHTLLSEYRKIQDNRPVPFIFLSALSERADFRNGMRLGADDYLSKPFTHKELLDAMNTQFQKHNERQLKIENDLETEVNDRLDAAELEKEAIIQELHHRVKHNLAIISAFFELEDFSKGEESIESIKQRVHALASVHEEAYSTETMTRVAIKKLIYGIVDKLLVDVDTTMTEEVEDYYLDIAYAIPFGLLFHEIMTLLVRQHETVKEPATLILRSFRSEDRGVLSLTTRHTEPIKLYETASDTGIVLLQAYIAQMKGNVNVDIVPGSGVRYTIDFCL